MKYIPPSEDRRNNLWFERRYAELRKIQEKKNQPQPDFAWLSAGACPAMAGA